MITDGQKNTPAPWVPFTRAGCDVGGVGTANIELENASTAATGDITKVFGTGSPEWNEAAANSQLGQTDFVGIAIHCSQASTSECAGNAERASPIRFRTSRAATRGFNALYGTKYVDPAITGGNACVNDTNGEPDHGSGRLLRLPGLRRDAREEHARLRRGDAGVRRAGHVRLHLRRARPPRPDARERLVLEHGDRPGRARAQAAAEGLRRRVRGVLQGPRAARDHAAEHAVRRSPSTRATTSPAASARRRPAATGSSTTTARARTSATCPTNQIGEVEREPQGPAARRRARRSTSTSTTRRRST